MDKKYSPIEWEGLQSEFILRNDLTSDFLNISEYDNIKFGRNDDYRIIGVLSGKQPNMNGVKQNRVTFESQELLEPAKIFAKNDSGSLEFHILDSTLSGPQTSNFLGEFKANISIKEMVVKNCNKQFEASSLTDWYLNFATENTLIFDQTTERVREETISINRVQYKDKTIKSLSKHTESSGYDYMVVELESYSFIIHKVPIAFEPQWSTNVGFEFREDFGGIPSIEEREAISEIVSFVLGRPLMKIGHTLRDSNHYPFEKYSKNAWWTSAKQKCSRPSMSPIYDYSTRSWQQRILVSQLQKLIPAYLSKREVFNLKESLWRCWLAEDMAAGVSIPMYSNGLEIMCNSWFKSKETKTSGVYMPQKEFSALLSDEFQLIEDKLKDVNYGDRILRKIKNQFQMSHTEKMTEFFFAEIGLPLGDFEKSVISSRGKMTHAHDGDYDINNVAKMIRYTNGYRTLFSRVFLKLLGYEGNYIDYSSVGYPLIHIDKPSGEVVAKQHIN